MSQNSEIQQNEAEGSKLLELQRDMILIKDRLDLLENGLYAERKRNAGILRTIRKLKEDPEVTEVLEALQYYKNPEMSKPPQNPVINYKAGDSLPAELFNTQTAPNNMMLSNVGSTITEEK